MSKNKLHLSLLLMIFLSSVFGLKAQVGLPLYSDYLSDNIILLHPSASGLGKGAKLRLTHRQQWATQDDSPSFQTISYTTALGEKSGIGGVVFNDRNGYHKQLGLNLMYAYKLKFNDSQSRYRYKKDLNQLTFALSANYVQQSVDQRSFIIPDPIISQTVQNQGFFNTDFSIAYHYKDGYSYLTVDNLMTNKQQTNNPSYQNLNRRKYIFNAGYFFGSGRKLQFEPSILFQYNAVTHEQFMDINTKAFRTMGRNKRIWMAMSYRARFDKEVLSRMNQFTPIVGVEIDQYLMAYTYTQQLGPLLFGQGSYHQVTFGYRFKMSRLRNKKLNGRINEYLYKSDN